jgi:hypothetical protein
MGIILPARVQASFLRGTTAATTTDQGRALEDLVCYLFEAVPGITVTERNAVNAFGTEEVDVAFWNDQPRRGLWFLPTTLLVECKNWSRPVGSAEVAYFVRRAERALLLITFRSGRSSFLPTYVPHLGSPAKLVNGVIVPNGRGCDPSYHARPPTVVTNFAEDPGCSGGAWCGRAWMLLRGVPSMRDMERPRPTPVAPVSSPRERRSNGVQHIRR